MVKQLRKVGNSSAITLDKTLMELVGLEEGGAVQVHVKAHSIILTPVKPRTVSDKEFKIALARVMKDHGEVLRRLAK